MDEYVKIAVTLPRDTVDALKSIATKHNWSFADVITQSINMNKFLLEHEDRKASVLIEDEHGKLTRVLRT